MIAKLIHQYKGFKRKRLVERLENQLSFLESTDTKREMLPKLLAEFWAQLDVSLFEDISARQWMCDQVDLRHTCLGELIDTLYLVNNYCANQDDEQVEQFSRKEFREPCNVTMDAYFADDKGIPLPIYHSLLRVKGLIQGHSCILDMLESQYYARLLNRVYHDILVLTRHLVNQL